MEKSLSGKKVAICGTRKIDELTNLIAKQGGSTLVRPLQGTVFLAEKEVEPDLVKFIQKGADWTVFTTGIGIETLIEIAANLGLKESFITRIRESKVVSRGYKTLAALKRLEITPIAVDTDGTTRGLIQALEGYDYHGCDVMIQLHGETSPALTSFFEARGAAVQMILPYQHIPPEDENVAKLCEEIQTNECDAVCFTTATQVRSLFDYAREHAINQDIVDAFKEKALAVAVGKVTATTLRDEGVDRILIPDNERMGAMIIELARHFK